MRGVAERPRRDESSRRPRSATRCPRRSCRRSRKKATASSSLMLVEGEVAVELEPLPARADRHRGDGEDLVVAVALHQQRSLPARRPDAPHAGREHEATLIEESHVPVRSTTWRTQRQERRLN